jgi:hypothetical protein
MMAIMEASLPTVRWVFLHSPDSTPKVEMSEKGRTNSKTTVDSDETLYRLDHVVNGG